MSNAILHITCPTCHAKNRLAESKLANKQNCGGYKSPLFTGKPLSIEQGLFDKHLLGSDIPLLVDF